MSKIRLSYRSDLAIAIAAVNRPITTGLERYFSFLATLSTDYAKHLAGSPVTAAPEALGLPCLAARRTALGLIGVSSGLKKLLLFCTVDKGLATIGTLDRLVLKTHWTTSSLWYFS
jgi:hypothetical protein